MADDKNKKVSKEYDGMEFIGANLFKGDYDKNGGEDSLINNRGKEIWSPKKSLMFSTVGGSPFVALGTFGDYRLYKEDKIVIHYHKACPSCNGKGYQITAF